MPSQLPLPAKPPRTRCVFLVDGFNLYHSLRDNPKFCDFRWLNIDALARAFLAPSKEALTCTFFFTALPTWDDDQRQRHQRLLRVYEDLGVVVKHGVFSSGTRTCLGSCGEIYDTREEKNTDINICLEMMRMGRDDIADRIYLLTADSDQVASIKEFKALYPGKQVYVLFPPGRYSTELQQVSDQDMRIGEQQLQSAQLSDPHTNRKGDLIPKPQKWCVRPTKFPVRRTGFSTGDPPRNP